jgi:hypothetical protein
MTNRRSFLILGATLAMFATACDSDKVTEANNNPNDPTDAPSTALFTNSVRLGAARWLDGVGGTRYGFLAQHFAEVQYPDDDTYQSARLGAAATTPLFDRSYSAELQDLDLLIDRGITANDAGLWGPALVLSTWEFGVLTDVFGDIPFTETFQAREITQPAYDPQKTVYDSIFVRLNAASDALASADASLGSGDPIYGGDPESWRRFANSLRLRHAVRLANVGSELARINSEIAAARAASEGGLIEENDQNATLVWPGDGIYDNPWANNFKGRDDHRLSTRFMSIMRDLQDPRVTKLAMPAPTVIPEIHTVEVGDETIAHDVTINYCPGGGATCYVGLANALTQDIASPLIPNTSRPGEIFYPGVTAYGTFGGPGKAFPSFFFTAAETNFLLAEAAERGWGGLSAAQAPIYYNRGITRAMELLGIDAGDITTYLARPGVAYVAGPAGLTQIAVQKWLALFTDQIQAWTEVRRTCQPAIVEPGPFARFDTIPRRLQYSTTDRAVNRTQYNEGVAGLTPSSDVMTARFYWDNRAGWLISPTFAAGCSVRED